MNHPRVVRLAEVAQAVGQALNAHGVAIVAVERGVAADGAFAHQPSFTAAELAEMVSGLRKLADDIESGGARAPRPLRCSHPRLKFLPLAAAKVCVDCGAIVGGPPPQCTRLLFSGARCALPADHEGPHSNVPDPKPARGERWRRLDSSDVWTVVDVRTDSGGRYLVKLELPAAEDELEPTEREVHSDRFLSEWERAE